MKGMAERGSYTIEAILSLTIFMFAFITIVSLATIARVESITQYAIDQVAKEISQYYYVADRIGLANTNSGGVDEIDDAVGAIMSFADMTSETVTNFTDTTAEDLGSVLDNYTDLSNDVAEVSIAASDVYNSFKPIFDDPKGVVSSLATMLARNVGQDLITKIIAQPLCKALLPKYITSSGDANAALERMGVIDGLDGLDFRMSTFLKDQRSINIVLVYRIKVNTFGIFDETLVIKQTASTAAWIKGTSLSESITAESTWKQNPLKYGKDFVNIIQQENWDDAVKGGHGIDLYNQNTNTFTSVHSMNVFAASYSNYQIAGQGSNNATNYTLSKSKIKSVLKGYATTLEGNIDRVGDNLNMCRGGTRQTADESSMTRAAKLVIVIPEEANTSNMLTVLNEIANEIENETGKSVKVEFTYREKALGD